MAQNFKSTGTKISQYPFAEINAGNFKNKIQHDHKFISYADANYGVAGVRKNFQVPIGAIRNDLLGFVGVNNAKGQWRDYITFWEGDWYNDDKRRSYVTTWQIGETANPDYIKNKFGLDEEYDNQNNIHRIFLLNTAPWPLESTDKHFTSITEKNYGADSNPKNVKFVSKNYVDDRHCGVRKIDVQDYKSGDSGCPYKTNPSHLSIRPYTCFYQYSNKPEVNERGCYYIDIHDDCVLENGTTFYDKVKHNRLTFYLRLKNYKEFYENNGVHCNNLELLVNGKPNVVKWSYEDEWTEILREHRLKMVNGVVKNTEKEYIFLKCEAEYVNEIFTITCSSFFGRKKAIKRMVEIPIPENGFTNIDLSLHENECFVSQIPLDDLTNNESKITRDQTVINLDVSKLDDYHMYSWDYFIITPDDDGKDQWDYSKLVFSGTPILWANSDNFNIEPEFQPNKMYCLEFVKAFDGVLIGRIKYYVSLIKKA